MSLADDCLIGLLASMQINMHFSNTRVKGDISTLLSGRHFYFALTVIDL